MAGKDLETRVLVWTGGVSLSKVIKTMAELQTNLVKNTILDCDVVESKRIWESGKARPTIGFARIQFVLISKIGEGTQVWSLGIFIAPASCVL